MGLFQGCLACFDGEGVNIIISHISSICFEPVTSTDFKAKNANHVCKYIYGYQEKTYVEQICSHFVEYRKYKSVSAINNEECQPMSVQIQFRVSFV